MAAKKVITNRDKFLALEPHWATVRLGYIREIPDDVKREIERIYKEEIEPGWIANYYCSACFYNACERLIRFYNV